MYIAFACDKNYAKRIGPIMRSILKHTQESESTRFYIFSCSITNKQVARLKKITPRIEIITIDAEDFANCPLSDACKHITLPAYYRFLIAEKLETIDKLLYLDCDVIVSNRIDELWNTDLSHCCAAVVKEYGKISQKEQKDRLGLEPGDHYFNSGVMLLNLKAWREQGIAEELFRNTEILRDRISWVDQDVLNYTLRERVIWMPQKYNFQQKKIPRGVAESSDSYPSIIHYLGPEKPWNVRCKHPLKWHYLQFMTRAERWMYMANYIRSRILDVRLRSGAFNLRLLNIRLVQYKKNANPTGNAKNRIGLRLLGVLVFRK